MSDFLQFVQSGKEPVQVGAQQPVTVVAKPGQTYNLIDPDTGKTPLDAVVHRDANNLVITSPGKDAKIVLQDFWNGECTVDDKCYAVLDVPKEEKKDDASAQQDGAAKDPNSDSTADQAVANAQQNDDKPQTVVITQDGPVLEHLLAGEVGTLDDGALLPIVDSDVNGAMAAAPLLLAGGLLLGLGGAAAALAGGGGNNSSNGSGDGGDGNGNGNDHSQNNPPQITDLVISGKNGVITVDLSNRKDLPSDAIIPKGLTVHVQPQGETSSIDVTLHYDAATKQFSASQEEVMDAAGKTSLNNLKIFLEGATLSADTIQIENANGDKVSLGFKEGQLLYSPLTANIAIEGDSVEISPNNGTKIETDQLKVSFYDSKDGSTHTVTIAPNADGAWESDQPYPGLSVVDSKTGKIALSQGLVPTNVIAHNGEGDTPSPSDDKAPTIEFANAKGVEGTCEDGALVILADGQGHTFEAHGENGKFIASAQDLINAFGKNYDGDTHSIYAYQVIPNSVVGSPADKDTHVIDTVVPVVQATEQDGVITIAMDDSYPQSYKIESNNGSFTATISFDDGVWKSDNPNEAKVNDKGVVTLESKNLFGVSDLTITATDKYGNRSNSYSLPVLPGISNVKANGDGITVTVDGEVPGSAQVYAKIGDIEVKLDPTSEKGVYHTNDFPSKDGASIQAYVKEGNYSGPIKDGYLDTGVDAPQITEKGSDIVVTPKGDADKITISIDNGKEKIEIEASKNGDKWQVDKGPKDVVIDPTNGVIKLPIGSDKLVHENDKVVAQSEDAAGNTADSKPYRVHAPNDLPNVANITANSDGITVTLELGDGVDKNGQLTGSINHVQVNITGTQPVTLKWDGKAYFLAANEIPGYKDGAEATAAVYDNAGKFGGEKSVQIDTIPPEMPKVDESKADTVITMHHGSDNGTDHATITVKDDKGHVGSVTVKWDDKSNGWVSEDGSPIAIDGKTVAVDGEKLTFGADLAPVGSTISVAETDSVGNAKTYDIPVLPDVVGIKPDIAAHTTTIAINASSTTIPEGAKLIVEQDHKAHAVDFTIDNKGDIVIHDTFPGTVKIYFQDGPVKGGYLEDSSVPVVPAPVVTPDPSGVVVDNKGADDTKVTIKDPDNKSEVTIESKKNPDGKYEIVDPDKHPGVTVDENTGVIHIPKRLVPDGSTVSATNEDNGHESKPTDKIIDPTDAALPVPSTVTADVSGITATFPNGTTFAKGQEVKAIIVQPDGTPVDTVELEHQADGSWKALASVIGDKYKAFNGDTVRVRVEEGDKHGVATEATVYSKLPDEPSVDEHSKPDYVLITPAETAHQITLTLPDGKTFVAEKDSKGQWAIKTSPAGVTIDSSTGVVSVDEHAAPAGSKITAVNTDPVNQHSEPETIPVLPDVKTIKPDDKGNIVITLDGTLGDAKLTVTIIDSSGHTTTKTLTASDAGSDGKTFTLPNVPAGAEVNAVATEGKFMGAGQDYHVADPNADAPHVTENGTGGITITPGKDNIITHTVIKKDGKEIGSVDTKTGPDGKPVITDAEGAGKGAKPNPDGSVTIPEAKPLVPGGDTTHTVIKDKGGQPVGTVDTKTDADGNTTVTGTGKGEGAKLNPDGTVTIPGLQPGDTTHTVISDDKGKEIGTVDTKTGDDGKTTVTNTGDGDGKVNDHGGVDIPVAHPGVSPGDTVTTTGTNAQGNKGTEPSTTVDAPTNLPDVTNDQVMANAKGITYTPEETNPVPAGDTVKAAIYHDGKLVGTVELQPKDGKYTVQPDAQGQIMGKDPDGKDASISYTNGDQVGVAIYHGKDHGGEGVQTIDTVAPNAPTVDEADNPNITAITPASDADKLHIEVTSPDGTTTQDINAHKDPASKQWVADGKLPEGVELDPETGKVSIPESVAPAGSTVTATNTDAVGNKSEPFSAPVVPDVDKVDSEANGAITATVGDGGIPADSGEQVIATITDQEGHSKTVTLEPVGHSNTEFTTEPGTVKTGDHVTVGVVDKGFEGGTATIKEYVAPPALRNTVDKDNSPVAQITPDASATQVTIQLFKDKEGTPIKNGDAPFVIQAHKGADGNWVLDQDYTVDGHTIATIDKTTGTINILEKDANAPYGLLETGTVVRATDSIGTEISPVNGLTVNTLPTITGMTANAAGITVALTRPLSPGESITFKVGKESFSIDYNTENVPNNTKLKIPAEDVNHGLGAADGAYANHKYDGDTVSAVIDYGKGQGDSPSATATIDTMVPDAPTVDEASNPHATLVTPVADTDKLTITLRPGKPTQETIELHKANGKWMVDGKLPEGMSAADVDPDSGRVTISRDGVAPVGDDIKVINTDAVGNKSEKLIVPVLPEANSVAAGKDQIVATLDGALPAGANVVAVVTDKHGHADKVLLQGPDQDGHYTASTTDLGKDIPGFAYESGDTVKVFVQAGKVSTAAETGEVSFKVDAPEVTENGDGDIVVTPGADNDTTHTEIKNGKGEVIGTVDTKKGPDGKPVITDKTGAGEGATVNPDGTVTIPHKDATHPNGVSTGDTVTTTGKGKDGVNPESSEPHEVTPPTHLPDVTNDQVTANKDGITYNGPVPDGDTVKATVYNAEGKEVGTVALTKGSDGNKYTATPNDGVLTDDKGGKVPYEDGGKVKVAIYNPDGQQHGGEGVKAIDTVAPNAPKVDEASDPDVTAITPADDADTLHIEVKRPDGATQEINAHKDPASKWVADDKLPEGVTIDPETGKVSIPESVAPAGSTVTASNTDAAGNTSDALNAPVLPDVNKVIIDAQGKITATVGDGDVPAGDTVKAVITHANGETITVDLTPNKDGTTYTGTTDALKPSDKVTVGVYDDKGVEGGSITTTFNPPKVTNNGKDGGITVDTGDQPTHTVIEKDGQTIGSVDTEPGKDGKPVITDTSGAGKDATVDPDTGKVVIPEAKPLVPGGDTTHTDIKNGKGDVIGSVDTKTTPDGKTEITHKEGAGEGATVNPNDGTVTIPLQPGDKTDTTIKDSSGKEVGHVKTETGDDGKTTVTNTGDGDGKLNNDGGVDIPVAKPGVSPGDKVTVTSGGVNHETTDSTTVGGHPDILEVTANEHGIDVKVTAQIPKDEQLSITVVDQNGKVVRVQNFTFDATTKTYHASPADVGNGYATHQLDGAKVTASILDKNQTLDSKTATIDTTAPEAPKFDEHSDPEHTLISAPNAEQLQVTVTVGKEPKTFTVEKDGEGWHAAKGEKLPVGVTVTKDGVSLDEAFAPAGARITATSSDQAGNSSSTTAAVLPDVTKVTATKDVITATLEPGALPDDAKVRATVTAKDGSTVTVTLERQNDGSYEVPTNNIPGYSHGETVVVGVFEGKLEGGEASATVVFQGKPHADDPSVTINGKGEGVVTPGADNDTTHTVIKNDKGEVIGSVDTKKNADGKPEITDKDGAGEGATVDPNTGKVVIPEAKPLVPGGDTSTTTIHDKDGKEIGKVVVTTGPDGKPVITDKTGAGEHAKVDPDGTVTIPDLKPGDKTHTDIVGKDGKTVGTVDTQTGNDGKTVITGHTGDGDGATADGDKVVIPVAKPGVSPGDTITTTGKDADGKTSSPDNDDGKVTVPDAPATGVADVTSLTAKGTGIEATVTGTVADGDVVKATVEANGKNLVFKLHKEGDHYVLQPNAQGQLTATNGQTVNYKDLDGDKVTVAVYNPDGKTGATQHATIESAAPGKVTVDEASDPNVTALTPADNATKLTITVQPNKDGEQPTVIKTEFNPKDNQWHPAEGTTLPDGVKLDPVTGKVSIPESVAPAGATIATTSENGSGLPTTDDNIPVVPDVDTVKLGEHDSITATVGDGGIPADSGDKVIATITHADGSSATVVLTDPEHDGTYTGTPDSALQTGDKVSVGVVDQGVEGGTATVVVVAQPEVNDTPANGGVTVVKPGEGNTKVVVTDEHGKPIAGEHKDPDTGKWVPDAGNPDGTVVDPNTGTMHVPTEGKPVTVTGSDENGHDSVPVTTKTDEDKPEIVEVINATANRDGIEGTVSGNAEGDTVKVTITDKDGAFVATATVDKEGHFNIEPKDIHSDAKEDGAIDKAYGPALQGDKVEVQVVSDKDGQPVQDDKPYTTTVDVIAPDAPEFDEHSDPDHTIVTLGAGTDHAVVTITPEHGDAASFTVKGTPGHWTLEGNVPQGVSLVSGGDEPKLQIDENAAPAGASISVKESDDHGNDTAATVAVLPDVASVTANSKGITATLQDGAVPQGAEVVATVMKGDKVAASFTLKLDPNHADQYHVDTTDLTKDETVSVVVKQGSLEGGAASAVVDVKVDAPKVQENGKGEVVVTPGADNDTTHTVIKRDGKEIGSVDTKKGPDGKPVITHAEGAGKDATVDKDGKIVIPEAKPGVHAGDKTETTDTTHHIDIKNDKGEVVGSVDTKTTPDGKTVITHKEGEGEGVTVGDDGKVHLPPNTTGEETTKTKHVVIKDEDGHDVGHVSITTGPDGKTTVTGTGEGAGAKVNPDGSVTVPPAKPGVQPGDTVTSTGTDSSGNTSSNDHKTPVDNVDHDHPIADVTAVVANQNGLVVTISGDVGKGDVVKAIIDGHSYDLKASDGHYVFANGEPLSTFDGKEITVGVFHGDQHGLEASTKIDTTAPEAPKVDETSDPNVTAITPAADADQLHIEVKTPKGETTIAAHQDPASKHWVADGKLPDGVQLDPETGKVSLPESVAPAGSTVTASNTDAAGNESASSATVLPDVDQVTANKDGIKAVLDAPAGEGEHAVITITEDGATHTMTVDVKAGDEVITVPNISGNVYPNDATITVAVEKDGVHGGAASTTADTMAPDAPVISKTGQGDIAIVPAAHEALSSITVKLGDADNSPSFTATHGPDGWTLSGAVPDGATIDAHGRITIPKADVTDGETITATDSDLAGNVSASATLTVDVSAPDSGLPDVTFAEANHDGIHAVVDGEVKTDEQVVATYEVNGETASVMLTSNSDGTEFNWQAVAAYLHPNLVDGTTVTVQVHEGDQVGGSYTAISDVTPPDEPTFDQDELAQPVVLTPSEATGWATTDKLEVTVKSDPALAANGKDGNSPVTKFTLEHTGDHWMLVGGAEALPEGVTFDAHTGALSFDRLNLVTAKTVIETRALDNAGNETKGHFEILPPVTDVEANGQRIVAHVAGIGDNNAYTVHAFVKDDDGTLKEIGNLSRNAGDPEGVFTLSKDLTSYDGKEVIVKVSEHEAPNSYGPAGSTTVDASVAAPVIEILSDHDAAITPQGDANQLQIAVTNKSGEIVYSLETVKQNGVWYFTPNEDTHGAQLDPATGKVSIHVDGEHLQGVNAYDIDAAGNTHPAFEPFVFNTAPALKTGEALTLGDIKGNDGKDSESIAFGYHVTVTDKEDAEVFVNVVNGDLGIQGASETVTKDTPVTIHATDIASQDHEAVTVTAKDAHGATDTITLTSPVQGTPVILSALGNVVLGRVEGIGGEQRVDHVAIFFKDKAGYQFVQDVPVSTEDGSFRYEGTVIPAGAQVYAVALYQGENQGENREAQSIVGYESQAVTMTHAANPNQLDGAVYSSGSNVLVAHGETQLPQAGNFTASNGHTLTEVKGQNYPHAGNTNFLNIKPGISVSDDPIAVTLTPKADDHHAYDAGTPVAVKLFAPVIDAVKTIHHPAEPARKIFGAGVGRPLMNPAYNEYEIYGHAAPHSYVWFKNKDAKQGFALHSVQADENGVWHIPFQDKDLANGNSGATMENLAVFAGPTQWQPGKYFSYLNLLNQDLLHPTVAYDYNHTLSSRYPNSIQPLSDEGGFTPRDGSLIRHATPEAGHDDNLIYSSDWLAPIWDAFPNSFDWPKGYTGNEPHGIKDPTGYPTVKFGDGNNYVELGHHYQLSGVLRGRVEFNGGLDYLKTEQVGDSDAFPAIVDMGRDNDVVQITGQGTGTSQANLHLKDGQWSNDIKDADAHGTVVIEGGLGFDEFLITSDHAESVFYNLTNYLERPELPKTLATSGNYQGDVGSTPNELPGLGLHINGFEWINMQHAGQQFYTSWHTIDSKAAPDPTGKHEHVIVEVNHQLIGDFFKEGGGHLIADRNGVELDFKSLLPKDAPDTRVLALKEPGAEPSAESDVPNDEQIDDLIANQIAMAKQVAGDGTFSIAGHAEFSLLHHVLHIGGVTNSKLHNGGDFANIIADSLGINTKFDETIDHVYLAGQSSDWEKTHVTDTPAGEVFVTGTNDEKTQLEYGAGKTDIKADEKAPGHPYYLYYNQHTGAAVFLDDHLAVHFLGNIG